MTEARLGYGTLLQRYTGTTPGVMDGFETVAEQVNISGPNFTSDDVEVTSHDSPDSTKEFIPALMDTGAISFDGNFIPSDAMQQQLITDQVNRTVSDWRIVLPDATDYANRTKWSFEGYIKTLDFSYPTPTQMTINGTMKLAGAAIFASAYSADLSALVVTGGGGALTAVPTVTGGTYEYSYAAPNTDATVTVTPTGTGVITVNGTVVETTQASGAISLDVGINIISVKKTDADLTPRIYSLYVTRAAS